ncbi:MAG: B12-binding domain-containing radical SAM protein [Oscillospiraceae bacterium]|nr:B12-binding domain-containing radical SAM protein [Oscillospiraceae bacterium]
MQKDKKNDAVDILLVWPPIENYFSAAVPSIGLAYLAAVLEPHYNVRILECNNEGMYSADAVIEYIRKMKPRVAGFHLATLCVPCTEEIVKALKEDDECPVFLAGGPHASALPAETLDTGIDYIAIGEAEATIVELMDYICGKPNALSPDDIESIAFKRDGQTVITNKRKLLDVNTLPYPAWHLFNKEDYSGALRKTDKILPVMSSRGCPESCTFCYKEIFGTSIRFRNPKDVVDEIEYLKDTFQIEQFAILDENFTLSKKHAMEFCNLLIERDLNLGWYLGNGVRVDSTDEEVIAIMKKAGNYRIALGVDSGNDDILKELKKRITKEQARNAVAVYKKYGYEITTFFLIGAPSETKQTVQDTIDFAIELNPDIASFNNLTPLPGSELYKYYDAKGDLLTKDWRHYNYFYYKDRDPVYNHPTLTWDELRKLRTKAYRKFYFRFGYVFSQFRRLKSFSDFTLLLKKAFTFLGFMKTNL